MTQLLLDTHVLLWAQNLPERLPTALYDLMALPASDLLFSAASIWEVAIKHSQRRADFHTDPARLQDHLLASGYAELPILGTHAMAVSNLPPIHKDPFDRMLVAQATVEGIELLTVDRELARYPGPIRRF